MTDKRTIIKLKKSLRRGDQPEIAKRSGLSLVTINGFFNGRAQKMAEETHRTIVPIALDVIKERIERNKEAEMMVAEKVKAILG